MPELGTFVFRIWRSTIDLDLLFICRLIKSLFDIPHDNCTHSGVKGSFDQGRKGLDFCRSSDQKCSQKILRSSEWDYEHPTQKFPALFKDNCSYLYFNAVFQRVLNRNGKCLLFRNNFTNKSVINS